MRNASFIKRIFLRRLRIGGLGIALLLMVSLSQAQALPPPEVTNLACGIDDKAFEVVALSSTDTCVLIDVHVEDDCAKALKFIMGNRKFGIEAGGGGGVATGISEALVTTPAAAGIVYTLTRPAPLAAGKNLPECAIAD